MLKKLVNEIIFDLIITPCDPLLIKTGMVSVGYVDMTFVETARNGGKEYYLPGSSLKGLIRSHSEKIFKTLNDKCVCNIFHKNNSDAMNIQYCGENFKNKEKRDNDIENFYAYSHSCLSCRLFGSTYYSSRFHVSDAYINEGKKPSAEIRDGVGIDRFTGGAAERAKFELRVITGGEFKCSLHIRNFEIYQLGILACVIRDFEDGLMYVGSGKSRGLGRVKGNVCEKSGFRINFLKPIPEDSIEGLGALASKEEVIKYGLDENDFIKDDFIKTVKRDGTHPLKSSLIFDGESRKNLFKLAVKQMNERISKFAVK